MKVLSTKVIVFKSYFYQRSVNFEDKLSSREFFQKMIKWIRFYYYATYFRSFFWRNWRRQKDISKLPDLYCNAQKCTFGPAEICLKFTNRINTYNIILPLNLHQMLLEIVIVSRWNSWTLNCPTGPNQPKSQLVLHLDVKLTPPSNRGR